MGVRTPPKLPGGDTAVDRTLPLSFLNFQREGFSECGLTDVCGRSVDQGLRDPDLGEDEHAEMEGEPRVSELSPEDASLSSLPLLTGTILELNVCIDC